MCQIDLRAPLLLRVSVLKNIPHQNPFFNTDTQRSGVTQRERSCEYQRIMVTLPPTAGISADTLIT